MPTPREADEERRIADVGMTRSPFRLAVTYSPSIRPARGVFCAASLTFSIQPAMASGFASIHSMPLACICAMQSDPLAMLLDGDRHVAQHPKGCQGGVIREAGDMQSAAIARPDLPSSGHRRFDSNLR